MIYLDYQASTPLDPSVLKAMTPFYTELFGNPHASEHQMGRDAAQAVEIARSRVAHHFGYEPEGVIFTSGATEANNLAILGTAKTAVARRSIIVTPIEHASVLEPARVSGLTVLTVQVNKHGLVDMDHLATLLSEDVLLVSTAWVNNEIGVIQDIHRIADLAHGVGAMFHVDGAQSLCAVDVLGKECPADLLSLSSHKAYGPKGIGALCISPGIERRLTPLMHGGSQQRGLRAGTIPTGLCVGFASAIEYVAKHGEQDRISAASLSKKFYTSLLQNFPSTTLMGPDMEHRHPGNLSVKLPIEDARDLIQLVQDKIACSTGSACHSGSELPSHVLRGIGLSTEDARKVMRLSFGRFTTADDCDRAVEILSAAIDACKKFHLPGDCPSD